MKNSIVLYIAQYMSDGEIESDIVTLAQQARAITNADKALPGAVQQLCSRTGERCQNGVKVRINYLRPEEGRREDGSVIYGEGLHRYLVIEVCAGCTENMRMLFDQSPSQSDRLPVNVRRLLEIAEIERIEVQERVEGELVGR
jgi:hypothetical protein